MTTTPNPLTEHTNPRLAAAAVAIRTNPELLTSLVDALVTDVAVLGAKPEWDMDDNFNFSEGYTDMLIGTLTGAGVTLRDALNTGNVRIGQIIDNPIHSPGGGFDTATEAALDQVIGLDDQGTA